MTARGAAKDYAFKQKADWRGWAWNQLAERIPERERRAALVVGLFGAAGLDFDVARDKGFDPRGFVNIEKDDDATLEARRRGITTVKGDAGERLKALHVRPDAIFLDLCGGNTKPSRSAITGALGAYPRVLVVNMLRGRDDVVNPDLDGLGRRYLRRSEFVIELAFLWIVDTCRRTYGVSGEVAAETIARRNRWISSIRPRFHSYPSPGSDGRRSWFDSVALSTGAALDGELLDSRAARLLRAPDRFWSAALAVRTARLAR